VRKGPNRRSPARAVRASARSVRSSVDPRGPRVPALPLRACTDAGPSLGPLPTGSPRTPTPCFPRTPRASPRSAIDGRVRNSDPLHHQHQRLERRHGSRRVPEAHQHAARPEGVERRLPCVLADPRRTRRAPQRCPSAPAHATPGRPRDQHVVASVPPRHLDLRIRSHRPDHRRAERLRPLTRDLPDAARGGVEHDRLAGGHAMRPAGQILGRHALQHDRRAARGSWGSVRLWNVLTTFPGCRFLQPNSRGARPDFARGPCPSPWPRSSRETAVPASKLATTRRV